MTSLPTLMTLHFVGDFLLQSDWMALNKSTYWRALLLHTTIYSLCFANYGLSFVAITFLTHTLTDAVTSRITSELWFINLTPYDDCGECRMTMAQNEYLATVTNWKRHCFFVAIGADQLIHMWTLYLTAYYLGLL